MVRRSDFRLTEKLDITVGARHSDKNGGDFSWTPTDAFRTSIRPYAHRATCSRDRWPRPSRSDKPTIDTYKFSVAYRLTDMMVYDTYAEGFTSASEPLVSIGANSVVPTGVARGLPAATTALLDSRRGHRQHRDRPALRLARRQLRFNATYFDSNWDGMRVTLLPTDASGNTQPFPYARATAEGTADGFEFEVVWAPTDRLTLNVGLGLIDTNYIQVGRLRRAPTGNYPVRRSRTPRKRAGRSARSTRFRRANGGRILLVGNYGYMGDYARDAAYQRTLVDANGNPMLEPAYGIFNARFVYEPPAATAPSSLGQEPARTSCTSTAGSTRATRGATTSRRRPLA